MRRWRSSVAEVLLGPLLATIFLIPLLLGGVLGIGLSIAVTLADTSEPLSRRMASVWPQLGLVGWVAAAAVGVVALWIAILRHAERTVDTRLRFSLLAGILLGEIAALRWLWTMIHHQPGYDLRTWAVWLALLLGPMAVGARHLLTLVRPLRGDDAGPDL